MKSRIVSILLLASIVSIQSGIAQGKYLETVKVTDSIYVFKPKIDWLHGNGVAIIGKDGVFFVDTYITQLYALEAIQKLKAITKLPVKYVLNTHWHYDHCVGNYEFKLAYPDAKFIMHQATDSVMRTHVKGVFSTDLEDSKKGLASTENQLKERRTLNGFPITDSMVPYWEWHIREGKEMIANYRPLKEVPADISFTESLNMPWGNYRLEMKHIGKRAHSEGDVVLWIPNKKLLITGDIIVGPTPYETHENPWGMRDAVQEVIDMNPSIIIPGHGVVLYDLTYPKLVREAFDSYLREAEVAVKNNIPMKDAISSIKLDDLDMKFTHGDDLTKWAYRSFFKGQVVYRVYQRMGAVPK